MTVSRSGHTVTYTLAGAEHPEQGWGLEGESFRTIDALIARRDRVVGVSPIIAGATVKGPADRLMGPLGIEVSCVGVAEVYAPFCSTLVIDRRDAGRAADVAATGVRPVVAETLMTDARVAAALAQHALDAVA